MQRQAPKNKQEWTTGRDEVDQSIIEQGLRKKKELEKKALQTGTSKNKLKKLQKKQKWEQDKLIKRKQKRQKQRQKKKEKKLEESQNKQTQNLGNVQEAEDYAHTRRRKDEYQQKMQDGLKVVIDLQFYDLMNEKQLNSLVKQLSYCHAINRKMQKPFNYILTSVDETRAKFMDEKYNALKWGINILEDNVSKAFKIDDLVYLTGDAEEQIQDFDDSKIYIIGGIVDHNRLKKITYNYAKQQKIEVKRLPLKNIKLKTNVHLAVNHVWEWMLRKYNGETWDQSLQKVLPERKIVKEQIPE